MSSASIQIALSGMLAYSRGLDVISNNVANLNTPGFKQSDIRFQDVFYTLTRQGSSGGHDDFVQGGGVTAAATSMRFTPGEIRDSGSDTDVAVNGNGLFLVRDGDQTLYTRAGRFAFDEAGFLVSTVSGGRVAAIERGGNLRDFELGELRISPARATSRIEVVDNLSSGSSEHEISNVEIFDSVGDTHTVSLVFRNNSSVTPRSWLVTVKNEAGEESAQAGEVRFSGDGSPLAGFEKTTFTFQPENGDAFEVTIALGAPGRFDGATSFSAGSTSTLQLASQDGVAAGSILGLAFNENGRLQIRYSNGDEATGPWLALAHFETPELLRQVGDGFFENRDGLAERIGAPDEGMLGWIVGGSLEVSNVELTEQFTELIIVQRGFQASSQVLSISNEILQELIESTRSRR